MTQELRLLTTADVPVLCYGTDGISPLTTAQIAAFGTAQITMLLPGATAPINPTLRSPYTAAIAADTGLAIVPLASQQVSTLGDGGEVRLGAAITTQAPAWKDFSIIAAAYYDAKYGTGNMPSDLKAVNGATAPTAALTTRGTVALTSSDILSLTTTQIVALTTNQVVSITTTQLGGLPTQEVSSLTTAQVAAISTSGITVITSTQVPAMTTDRLVSLSTAAISAIDAKLTFEHGGGSWAGGGGGGGSGSIQHTVELINQDTSLPIADAAVWMTTDVAGLNTIASGRTNAFGICIFNLDPGTYYFWKHKDGFNFTNPTTELVT